jgi:hypothetical protein
MRDLYVPAESQPATSSGGTVRRPIKAWLDDTVNVLAFIPLLEHPAIRAYTTTIYDATAAVQAAIDYSIYQGGKGEVFAPAGLYKTSDTLHLGYGTDFRSVVLKGAGYNYRGTSAMNGTVIVPNFSDRSIINIQGARGSVVRALGIVGLLTTYIDANGLCNDVPSIDDTLPANWNDPSLAATQDSQNAPYAGITIDGYSGTQPATHYPDVTYPSFLGAVSQYGKNFSSDVLIEDVYIAGFTVAVVNQPCNSDGNGDFTQLRRCYVEKCKWGVSVGNTQARNTSLYDVKFSRVYSALTNNQHGVKTGKFGSAIVNLSIFRAINIFVFGSYYASPITFVSPYAESLYKIGNYDAVGLNEQSIIFTGSQFLFSGQSNTRGHPAQVLTGAAGFVDIQFHGATFEGYRSVVGFAHAVSFDGADFRVVSTTTRPNTYEQIASNALCGGLVTAQFINPARMRMKSRYYNLDTGVQTSVPVDTVLWKNSTRVNCIPFWCENVSASSETGDRMVPPNYGAAVAKSALSSCTLSGTSLTIVFSSRTDASFLQQGPLPGDVIWDDQTGSVFFVRSRTTTTVIAELQNNIKSDGIGGWTLLSPFSTTVGALYFRNARLYTPTSYLRGDLAASNATISNCARDDGVAAYDADIVVGDALAVPSTRDFFTSTAAAIIAGRSQAGGTITLSVASGSTRAQTRRRLDYFIRQPPANV